MEVDLTNEYSCTKMFVNVLIEINGKASVVSALIDSGASFTCVDESLVPDGTNNEGSSAVVGVNKLSNNVEDYMRPRYRADISICGVKFKNVLVSATKGSQPAIIGMNIIRHLHFEIKNGICTLEAIQNGDSD